MSPRFWTCALPIALALDAVLILAALYAVL